jgi:hypothetical protein
MARPLPQRRLGTVPFTAENAKTPRKHEWIKKRRAPVLEVVSPCLGRSYGLRDGAKRPTEAVTEGGSAVTLGGGTSYGPKNRSKAFKSSLLRRNYAL